MQSEDERSLGEGLQHWGRGAAEELEAIRDPALREWFSHVVQLLDCVLDASIRFYRTHGLVWLPAPSTTGSVSSPMGLGSDSQPVEIAIDGRKLYLADSAQFLLEYGCRLVDRGCFYAMHSYRHEEPDVRHLPHFVHIEAEIPGGLEDVMEFAGAHVRALAAAILEHAAVSLSELGGDTKRLERAADAKNFRTLTFDECASILGDLGDCIKSLSNGARTLTAHGERALLSATGYEFLWVTNWDTGAVPFYQAVARDGRTALNADLLFGLGEVIGAGERHATVTSLDAAMVSHEISFTPYDWYRRLKRDTPLRTAGYGLGVERFLAWATGRLDVRPFQLFPRTVSQLGEP